MGGARALLKEISKRSLCSDPNLEFSCVSPMTSSVKSTRKHAMKGKSVALLHFSFIFRGVLALRPTRSTEKLA